MHPGQPGVYSTPTPTTIVMHRRRIWKFGKVLFFLLMGGACLEISLACTLNENGNNAMIKNRDTYRKGRLQAKPASSAIKETGKTGLQPLNLDGKRDGLLYVPATYSQKRPAALALMLHGAGGNAEHVLSLL